MRLYELREVTGETACRLSGTQNWEQINEFLPLLKYRNIITGAQAETLYAPRYPGVRWLLAAIAGLALLIVVVLILLPDTAPFERRSSTSHGPHLRSLPLVTEIRQTAPVVPARAMQRASMQGSREQRSEQAFGLKPEPRQQQRERASLRVEEFTIALNKWTSIKSSLGSFAVKIEDHGPVTFSVSIDHGGPRRLDKIKGFEATGENITEIHSLSRARAYFVDRISVSPGYCVIKVVPTSGPRRF